MFQRSVMKNKLIYRNFTADGDSNVYKAIQDANPYKDFNIQVVKQSCINHLYRNMGRKIREIGKTKGRGIAKEKKLVETSDLKFRDSIENAVKLRKARINNNLSNLSDEIELLKLDIANAPYHIFGNHTKCNFLENHCNGQLAEGETNKVPELEKAGLFIKLRDHFTTLSEYAKSFMYHATNNMAESYNGLVCQKVGGKRINHSQRGSYETRCYAAVLQRNTQAFPSRVFESENYRVPEPVSSFENRRRIKVRRNAERKLRNKNRRREKKLQKYSGPDKHYGPKTEKPDKTDEEYAFTLQRHDEYLLEKQKSRDKVEENTR